LEILARIIHPETVESPIPSANAVTIN